MEDYIVSSGNIFEDMGFEDAEERLTKAKLAAIINEIIRERELSPKEASGILGINKPKLTALQSGRLKGFTIERLFLFLESLDQHIEITVTHKSKSTTRQGINVAYV
jgi:predicted XRE-type DNA-binding protein